MNELYLAFSAIFKYKIQNTKYKQQKTRIQDAKNAKRNKKN